MFEQLTEYKATHGNCNVPLDWSENRKLASWIARLRARRPHLSSEQIARFDRLGFVWDPQGDAWERMFLELTRYKEKHGHCNIAQSCSEQPRLGTWVNTQRMKRRKGLLDPDRIKRLERIGVVWEALENRWEDTFTALVAYKAKFGTCDVAYDDRVYSKLCNWVVNQRQFRKRNKLSEDRIRRLDAIGFRWGTKCV